MAISSFLSHRSVHSSTFSLAPLQKSYREEANLRYQEKLKEKYSSHPEVRKIARRRHVPKHVLEATKERRVQMESRKRKYVFLRVSLRVSFKVSLFLICFRILMPFFLPSSFSFYFFPLPFFLFISFFTMPFFSTYFPILCHILLSVASMMKGGK